MDWYGSLQWSDTPPSGGLNHNIQYKNKLIAVTSPLDMSDKTPPKSLQSTLAFFNFQQDPTWKVYVDGQLVTELPFAASANQRITIRDGISYVGIIPLPATDLGRDAEVVLLPDVPVEMHYVPEQQRQNRMPGLRISNYMLKKDEPLDKQAADWKKVQQAYGGFVIEMSDNTEYPDFAAFQTHISRAVIETRWEENTGIAHVKYASGGDIIEFGFNPEYTRGQSNQLFTYRRVNGEWLYLPPGIDRDSTLSQQGTTGRLEKLGAVLEYEPGRMAFLQAEPITGTFAGYNPLPDPTFWQLSTPGGMKISADGRIGMARITVQSDVSTINIEHVLREGQKTFDAATAIVLSGVDERPAVEFNGADVSGDILQVEIDGKQAYVVPIRNAFEPFGFAERYKAAQRAWRQGAEIKMRDTLIQDWYVAGPFPNPDMTGFDTAFPPEKEPVELQAKYEGIDGAEIAWKRILPAGQPALGSGTVNLVPHFTPNTSATAYAYTKVVSDRDRTATLFAGSDDSITVWVNGEKVLARNVQRAVKLDDDRADIKLREGENTILLKIDQAGGGWGFAVRLADGWGVPLTGDGMKYGFE